MLSIKLNTPKDQQINISKKFRDLRLFRNLRRKTLAEMSGVPEPSIKRFELLGEVSLRSLLNLAHALGVLDQFADLFTLPQASSLAEIERMEKRHTQTVKKRGRR